MKDFVYLNLALEIIIQSNEECSKYYPLKEARLIELEFQGQIWLIQNLKCFNDTA